MKFDDAFGLADERAWEQTKSLLGPMPWHDQPDELFDRWIGQRDEFCSQLMSELISSGMVEEEDHLST